MTTPQSAPEQPSINRLHQLLGSDVFDRNRPNDGTCERAFTEVIRLLDGLLRQAEAAGQRIDFTKEVGVHGKIQDITSLISSMHSTLQSETATGAGPAANQFNCYYDAGNGYFANGVFFVSEYDNEVAFFVGEERVYLNRHLKRAMQEAETYLAQPAVTR